MHLQQVEEVKAQSQEIRCLLALAEKNQEAIQKLSCPHSPPRETRATTSCSESWLDVMPEGSINLILGTVNTGRGTAVLHNTTMATAPIINRTPYQDMLAEEAYFTPRCQPKHVKFLDTTEGVLHHLPHVNNKKRWPYLQGLLFKATLKKLDSTWLLGNLGRCESQKLAN